MPSFDTYKRMLSSAGSTIGNVHKNNSDLAMEYTWNNDIQSKICYIYDYFHDDQPELSSGMTYNETTKKTKIDAKFIITSYSSIDKDQVAYHLMFKPSQKVKFEEDDELYYYEEDYRNKYDVTFPIGMYIDIPDEKGVYVRWFICDYEEGNQFIKYTILPCDYRFQWISTEGNNRLKRQVWGCTRTMNNYGSGLWIDRYINTPNDVFKMILPLNSITENIHYVGENGSNQRAIISAKVKNPLVWKLSKLENTKPIGLLKMTFTQDVFNPNTDYLEKDENDNIIGMWADYYSPDLTKPVDNVEPLAPTTYVGCNLVCSSTSLKISGSYKSLTAHYYDKDYNDISSQYLTLRHDWKFTVKDKDGDDEDISELLDIKSGDNANTIKVKFDSSKVADARKYIGKHLDILLATDYYIFGKLSLGIIG